MIYMSVYIYVAFLDSVSAQVVLNTEDHFACSRKQVLLSVCELLAKSSSKKNLLASKQTQLSHSESWSYGGYPLCYPFCYDLPFRCC